MPLMIPGKSVELEAILREPDVQPLRAAAVLCDPHPIYGGTMDNRVVYRAGKAVIAAGMATLRFNFRGVGASTGAYDHGEGEKEDVAAAIDFLESRYHGVPLALVGFSFGAWVGLQVACRDPRIGAMVGLGLPVNFYDFDFLIANQKPARFIIGSRDEYCSRDKMERLARRLPETSTLQWIEGADHFFSQALDELQSLITRFFPEVRFQNQRITG